MMMTSRVVLVLVLVLAVVCASASDVSAAIDQCIANNNVAVTSTDTFDGAPKTVLYVKGNQWENGGTVFLLTVTGTLYKSGKGTLGRTWDDQTQYLPNVNVHRFGDKLKTGVKQITQTSTGQIIVLGYGYLWIKAGDNFSWQLQSMPTPSTVVYDILPSRVWDACILAGVASEQCYNRTSSEDCEYSLWLSLDLGDEWRQLSTNTFQYFFGNDTKRAIYSQFDGKYNPRNPDFTALDVYSVTTEEDGGQTSTATPIKIGEMNKGIAVINNITFKATMRDDDELQLSTSTDDGATWAVARFPMDGEDESREGAYTIVDLHQGSMVMNVRRFGSSSIGNLYMSDQLDTNFVQVLPNNYCFNSGQCAYSKIRGLQGFAIANTADVSVTPGSGGDLLPLRSLITFDNGGEWLPLTPPSFDVNGKPVTCTKTTPSATCSLHLHTNDRSGNWGGVVTSHNAIGLVMATGNVGDSLTTKEDEVSTFLSTDGGWTWAELLQESSYFSYGDHGGVVLMIPNTRATNQLTYTYDEGHSLVNCIFAEEDNFELAEIYAAPGNKNTEFIVVGSVGEGSETKHKVYHLDFSSLHQDVCVFPDQYDTWTPSSSKGSKCFLGESVSFSRRKPTEKCYNGQEYEQQQDFSPCACSRADYMCDYCFEPYMYGQVNNAAGAMCVSACFGVSDPIPSDCKDTYEESQGYRLVDGDKCLGGLYLGPKIIDCPKDSSSSGGSHHMIIIALLVVCLLVISVVAVVVLVMTAKQGSRVHGTVTAITDVGRQVLDRVPGALGRGGSEDYDSLSSYDPHIGGDDAANDFENQTYDNGDEELSSPVVPIPISGGLDDLDLAQALDFNDDVGDADDDVGDADGGDGGDGGGGGDGIALLEL
eukprot:TRINITY_DN4494_c2_g1_i1.p1 TRINITY_DN4494_c2_g1~~TRINITY_DN4494_c2_g1_i1.p1  ORF type:complete len:949 (-),score=294.24 TRINITY_DN4494_c2_g1_i1:73-2694(-)